MHEYLVKIVKKILMEKEIAKYSYQYLKSNKYLNKLILMLIIANNYYFYNINIFYFLFILLFF